MTNEERKFHAIVELFGHQKIAGLVSEDTIGGCSFLRVDVPGTDASAPFTKWFGDKAIYSMTPVSEELVLIFVKRYKPAPVSVYMPEIQQGTRFSISPGHINIGDAFGDDGDDEGMPL